MTVAKITELMGGSPNSWSKAAPNAANEAVETVKDIKGVYVKRCTSIVNNNKITEYMLM